MHLNYEHTKKALKEKKLGEMKFTSDQIAKSMRGHIVFSIKMQHFRHLTNYRLTGRSLRRRIFIKKKCIRIKTNLVYSFLLIFQRTWGSFVRREIFLRTKDKFVQGERNIWAQLLPHISQPRSRGHRLKLHSIEMTPCYTVIIGLKRYSTCT